MLEPRIIIGLSHGNNAAKTCKSKKRNTFHTHHFQCFIRTNIVTFCFTSNVFGQKNGGWKKQIGPIAAQKDRVTINLFTYLLVDCQSNCEWTYRPCVLTLFKLIINDLYLTFQSQPFCHAIWLKLPCNMAEIAR